MEIKNTITPACKMIIFDMYNTLLQYKFIEACAQKYFFSKELDMLIRKEKDQSMLLIKATRFLKGLSLQELLKIAVSIPLADDALEIVGQLKKRGNVVGIISDSYQFVADSIKNKVGADFAVGNQLELIDGRATGGLIIPSIYYYRQESKCNHAICKTNVLLYMADKYNIPLKNCIAIGDRFTAECMLEQAGVAIKNW